jgi:hypothetical protein
MKLDELPAFLDTELTYAVDHATVLERIGDVEVGAPGDRENETIASIIGATGQTEYASARELFETIVGNLSDEYIGRKFYDDRGGNPIDSFGEETNISL